ncbi:MAG: bi-domain-containing oxidoreductase [Anaerolineaceae bacterium]|nr:bi-domain-containing oxidoreductase [Anaerolineaceae bacterium]
MKQLIQEIKSGNAVVIDLPVPEARGGMALVKTASSLVSAGTERMVVEFAEKSLLGKAQSRPDLVRQVLDKARREGILTTIEATFNRLEQPMALGYSSAGTIVDLGADMDAFHIGQRVACAGGGYAVHAEYALVPKNLLTPLPDSVDFESAAFATIGAIAMHGFRLAEPQLGEKIAVIGLGLLGLLSVQLCLAAGCKVFGIDLDPKRVALAQRMGASAVVRDQAESAAKTETGGIGFDAVLICADTSSNDPVHLAAEIARDRAKVVAVGAVGLDIPRAAYYHKELELLISRSYGPGRYDPSYEEAGHDYPIGYVRWTEGRNMQSFIDLLAAKKIDVHPLITHRFPIESAPKAYELITGKLGEAFLGVLLTYTEEEQPGERIRQVKIQSDDAGASSDAIRLGVLGAGNYAKAVFLPMLRKSTNLRREMIVSATGMTAVDAGKRFGFAHAATNEDEILENEQINTVAILSRHQHHARQLLKALAHGKHVYCEKPLAINQQELNQIVDALAAHDRPKVMVGFNRRFAPMAVSMKDFLRADEPLVAHYRVNAGYIPISHWTQDPAQGGGRIIGESCHFIDFLCYLVGDVPEAVSAVGLPDDDRYQQDNVVLTLRFKNGSIGTVSYLANGDKAYPKEFVEVFQGGAVAALDDFRRLELVCNGRRTIYRSRLRQDKGHAAAWHAFTEAILRDRSAPIPYRQLLGVAQTTFMVMKALQSGKEETVESPR